ncbi:MAG TPA: long-chain fatty acid--CoA ligase, partial [Dissulfuribacter thermophilus]|nr:long-chain fatty acid--CoA ligase [Dissulfuribacter thermophilus]
CFISGRGKNLIVTPAGKNVYPEEIEAILCESPHILEAMVYGRPLPTGGEEVRALIVPDYETIGKLYKGPLSESKINGLISKDVKRTNKVLAGYKRIKSFQIRDEEFPKTSTRKIKRHLIQVT